MNEYEIEMYRERYRNHPVLGPATEYLYQYMLRVNSCSDGWPYWSAAPKAAKKLMELIQNPETATEAAFKKAQTPIKTLITKRMSGGK